MRAVRLANPKSITIAEYAGSTLCGLTDVNTYERADLPAAAFGSALSEPAGLELGCTTGVVSDVVFASFGQPHGTCGNFSVNDACHSPNSTAVVRSLCVGKQRCHVEATMQQFGGVDPCPRSGVKLNNGPQRLAVVLQGCTSSPLFELNVTVPVGAQADVVIPTRLLGVDPRAKTTSLAEGGRPVPADVDANGDLAVVAVGSGSYAFVLSAA